MSAMRQVHLVLFVYVPLVVVRTAFIVLSPKYLAWPMLALVAVVYALCCGLALYCISRLKRDQ